MPNSMSLVVGPDDPEHLGGDDEYLSNMAKAGFTEATLGSHVLMRVPLPIAVKRQQAKAEHAQRHLHGGTKAYEALDENVPSAYRNKPIHYATERHGVTHDEQLR